MNKLKLAAGLAALVIVPPAVAADGPKSPGEFSALYQSVVNQAAKNGMHPQRACFPRYCQQLVYVDLGEKSVTAFDLLDTEGIASQELCYGDLKTRRCWYSDGHVVDQRAEGDFWRVTADVAATYPGAPAAPK
jgi:hypothetical protein